MKKISRILWVMVTSCFVFLYTEKSTNAKEVSISEADISENYSEQSAVEITDESLANLALNFAKEFKGTEDLVVSSIIPIYDTEEKIISYSVDFIKEGVTHGYVIIDLRMEGTYIAQFSIELGSKSLYDFLADKSQMKVDNTEESYLIETFPTEYNLVVEDKDSVISTNGENFSLNEFEKYVEEVQPVAEMEIEHFSRYNSRSTKYDHASAVFSNYPSNLHLTSAHYLAMFNALSQSRSEKATGKYACAVHALATISSSYRFFNSGNDSELKVAYNSLWNYSGTTVSSTNNGISYGGTQPDQIGPALVKYAKDKSVSLTYQRKVSPSFSDIQTKIAQSYPVAFTYFYYKPNGSIGGHTVFTQGALSGTMNGAQANFIVVADGWYENATYLNYSTIPKTLQSYEISSWTGKKLFQ